jgi:hypothetical protein
LEDNAGKERSGDDGYSTDIHSPSRVDVAL